MSGPAPAVVFVGVHREARAPLRFLLSGAADVRGLVTLTPRAAAKVSGAVDLAPLAEAAGVPVLRTADVNAPEAVDWIREKRPDLLLVVGWTRLVRPDLLAVPRVAALGFHASLLPRYRGRAPVNWALIRGETETGNTLLVLDPEADAGDIVAQRRIPIAEEDDCATLYDKVAATEVEMLREVLPLVREGRLPRRPQDPAQATVMPRRRPEDGGIDWTWTTRRVRDWVRALTHPYPGAFADLAGARTWIWKVEPAEGVPGRPGDLSVDEGGWPVVRTGDGGVRLLRVQREGGPERDGRDAAAELAGARA